MNYEYICLFGQMKPLENNVSLISGDINMSNTLSKINDNFLSK